MNKCGECFCPPCTECAVFSYTIISAYCFHPIQTKESDNQPAIHSSHPCGYSNRTCKKVGLCFSLNKQPVSLKTAGSVMTGIFIYSGLSETSRILD